ncbi:MAG TPA: PD-(D/E)XK nuclease family protein, partial [Candidatus Dormibacteraeota bacterium]|nr:PD-(D/E)XK nuclease family protein [Candidatus Dormibacteraeota bacterium]
VRGAVDRVCEIDGQVALIDYKTNSTLDPTLLDAYALQLRIYGMAAHRGLLPGGREPRLILYDLRQGQTHEFAADDAFVEARIRLVSERIAAGDFRLGPEHEQRRCDLCAYRPICPDARNLDARKVL